MQQNEHFPFSSAIFCSLTLENSNYTSILSCLPRFITVYQAHFVFLVQRIIDYFSWSKTRLAEEKFVQFKRKTKFPVHRSRIIPCLHPPEYPFFSGEREREKEKTRGIENVSPLKIRVDRSIDRLIKRGGVSGSWEKRIARLACDARFHASRID